MTCPEARKFLPRIAERDGAPRVALETARHLAGCVACAGELLRLRELSGLLDRIPQPDVPASFPGRVLRALRSKRGAGILAVFVSIAAGMGGSAIGLRPSAGSVTSVLTDPIQAAGTLLSSFARALATLAGLLHASFDGMERSALSLTGSTSGSASSLIPLLGIVAALALAGSWTALGFSAVRLHGEQRRPR